MPSGYFSEPSEHLDPEIFDGMVIKPEVREGLLNLLYSDLENDVGFNEPWAWTEAWIAGSGASYQWGNGDLDVLFGVDFPQFLEANPQFPRLSEREVAEYTDQILRAKSWPKTRHVSIGGSKQKYEITFYWNPGMDLDIKNIHPYAAFNLTKGIWDVSPEPYPDQDFPHQWYSATATDYDNAWKIQDLYHSGGASGKLQGMNAARAMWRDIHEGRKAAFSDVGLGYGDWHNFRWQRAKATGAAAILRAIISDAEQQPEPESPRDIITRTALRYAGPKYWL